MGNAIAIVKNANATSMTGFAAEIVNTAQGTISSTGNGLTAAAIAFSGTLRVNNAGSILALGNPSVDETAAIRVNRTDNATLRLVNTSLISGFVTAIDIKITGLTALTLFNQGEILGRVLGGGPLTLSRTVAQWTAF